MEQNPWHDSGEVSDAWAQSSERPLAKHLPGRLQNDVPHRFQLILGPRRVGKTTSMYQTVRRLLRAGVPKRRLWWLRLDHPLLMQIDLGELVRYVMGATNPTAADPLFLFFDELTYADKWFLWLKNFYDQGWPLRIAATSSSTAALRDRRLESGVGRWEEQYLAPYLFPEFLELIEPRAGPLTGREVIVRPLDIPTGDSLADTIEACIRADIDVSRLVELRQKFLLTGGFPELLKLLIPSTDRPAEDQATLLLRSQRTLRSDAVERAVYKDIPQVFGVDSPMMLERLLYTLAGQVTGVLSPQAICKELAGMSQPTFSRYLSYLERAFLVFLLPNYSPNEASVQKRGRKLYFMDAAVRNAALQRGLAPLDNPIEMGLLIENMAATHLQALSEQSQDRLYYWRDKNEEVDFILDHPNKPLAFEIGLSGSHHRKGLQAFAARFARFKKHCFLVAPGLRATQPEDNRDKVGTLPLDLFLLAVGAQAEKELANRLAPNSPRAIR